MVPEKRHLTMNITPMGPGYPTHVFVLASKSGGHNFACKCCHDKVSDSGRRLGVYFNKITCLVNPWTDMWELNSF